MIVFPKPSSQGNTLWLQERRLGLLQPSAIASEQAAPPAILEAQAIIIQFNLDLVSSRISLERRVASIAADLSPRMLWGVTM